MAATDIAIQVSLTNVSQDYSDMVERLKPDVTIPMHALQNPHPYDVYDLLHASIGISSEAGEFADVLKKLLFASRPVDMINVKEELGDLLWYIQLACNAIGSSIPECMAVNTKKLAFRHGEKFNPVTGGDYSKRDLKAERAILEE